MPSSTYPPAVDFKVATVTQATSGIQAAVAQAALSERLRIRRRRSPRIGTVSAAATATTTSSSRSNKAAYSPFMSASPTLKPFPAPPLFLHPNHSNGCRSTVSSYCRSFITTRIHREKTRGERYRWCFRGNCRVFPDRIITRVLALLVPTWFSEQCVIEYEL